MQTPNADKGNSLATAVASAVERYRRGGEIGRLLADLSTASSGAGADDIIAAAERYRDLPEVIGPLYERVVELRPSDARALVTLASAYWMAGRGPDVVADLASRALSADPSERGAWHLWALAEPDVRGRVARWRQVAERFPGDELARVNLADNAASLAGAEGDAEALALAIQTYESLVPTAGPEQRPALESAIATLRSWRL